MKVLDLYDTPPPTKTYPFNYENILGPSIYYVTHLKGTRDMAWRYGGGEFGSKECYSHIFALP